MANNGLTIDDLQIKIEAESTAASRTIMQLAGQLKSLASGTSSATTPLQEVASQIRQIGISTPRAKSSLHNVASEVKDLGTVSTEARTSTENLNNSIKITAEEMKRFKREFEESQKSAKNYTSSLGKLWKQFTRVAKMRAMRYVIKAITSAFSEGIQNLVEWDYAFENNTSGAYQTMTELKSLALQVKNTLGAMAMPIIQLVMPAIRLFAQGLMFVANLVNQVVRTLQGYGTYMKAVYTEVSAVEEATKRTTKAAKELQRVLFGFDELNVLPSPKGSSRGSTGVLDNIRIPEQFVEVEIDPRFKWLDSNVKGSVGDFISTFTKPLAEGWERLWSDDGPMKDPKGFINEVWESIKVDFNDAWNTFNETTLKPIGGWFSALWGDVSASFEKGWEDFKSKPILGSIISVLGDIFSGRAFTKSYWAQLWSGFKNDIKVYLQEPVERFWAFISETFPKIINFITHPSQWTQEGWTNLCNEISTEWQQMVNGIKIEQQGLQTWLDEHPTGIKLKPVNAFEQDKNSQGAFPGLHTLITDSSKYLNNNPLKFKTAIGAGGLATAMGNTILELQKGANKNPVKIPTSINGTVTGKGSTVLASIWKGADAVIRTFGKVLGFAEGGSIPNRGSLFVAGEAGPEVVANMGHSTGVMNINQMQEAVANGNVDVVNAIYAMANMVTNAVNNKSLDVYMDTQKVGKSVTNYQNNMTRRVGTPVVI